MKHWIMTIVLSLTVSAAHATETDDTTSYYTRIEDSEALLDAKTQELIQAGLNHHMGCNRQVLARQMAAVLVGNLFYGTVEDFANKSPAVDKVALKTKQSIYKGTPYDGGFVDTFVSLGPVINLAGFHVGTDKVGHFLDMGYDLYNRAKRGESVTELLAQSRWEESGLWGKWVTGVKSYGDIAANFDGHRFWTDLIDEGKYNFFVCDKGQFRQVREFRWSDYVSAAWTEAINCSEYSSDRYVVGVAEVVGVMEASTKRRYACPIAPEQCGLLRAHYARWIPESEIKEIVSPLCKEP